jgi:hypothetical protein
MGTILALITGCTPEIKPKARPQYVTFLKTDSKEMHSLKTSLSQYTKATINNDAKKLIGFVYPKAFTVISKESMFKKLNKAYSSGKIPMVKDVKHLKIEPIQKYNEGIYSIITSSMTTVLNSPKADDDAFESYMLDLLKDKFSSRGKVTLDKKKHQFNIEHTNKTIALNENNAWSFIGFKQAKKYAQKGFLPKIFIEKIQ